ncbi:MAG: HepT-like ribonuclease domain-containing protein [Desulfurobacteriaceae bacterium]
MKRRTYPDYVSDILLAINDIEDFTKGKEIREKYSDIPFINMAGIRDKLIHEYHGIDLEIIWNVIRSEIPPLKPKLEKLLEEIKNEEGI